MVSANAVNNLLTLAIIGGIGYIIYLKSVKGKQNVLGDLVGRMKESTKSLKENKVNVFKRRN